VRDKLTGSESDIETLEPPDIDEEFSQTIISLQEKEVVEEVISGEEPEAPEPVDPEARSISSDEEFDLEDFPIFEEDLEEDEILSSLEEGSSLETWEAVEEETEAEAELSVKELAVEPEDILETTEEQPESEEDIRKILHEVLSEEEDQEEDTSDTAEAIEPLPEMGFQTDEEQSQEKETEVEEVEGSSLDAELLPWEAEGDYAEENIEITPTPSLLTEEDQSADVLVDLLADTRLDTLSLNLEQPLYTCILVPELTEFSLNSKIASRIKEWLPRLSRVFGWQFVNIHVQPTYLQWTVRVPAGTSQGSIVRKVRQQTSLRIFEEFPELKQLSHSGNFWAKGYLVVSGGNPPPAEFLDDFIQKNRRSKGIFGP
jgi:REP element-mobilizing transposase RayT